MKLLHLNTRNMLSLQKVVPLSVKLIGVYDRHLSIRINQSFSIKIVLNLLEVNVMYEISVLSKIYIVAKRRADRLKRKVTLGGYFYATDMCLQDSLSSKASHR